MKNIILIYIFDYFFGLWTVSVKYPFCFLNFISTQVIFSPLVLIPNMFFERLQTVSYQ